jgi:hypothetical protein
MDSTQFVKQTLGFQKTIFENSYNAMIVVQDQTEKMMNSYLDQLPWVTEESKSSMKATVDLAKKAREDFKTAVDDGFTKFEEMLEKK